MLPCVMAVITAGQHRTDIVNVARAAGPGLGLDNGCSTDEWLSWNATFWGKYAAIVGHWLRSVGFGDYCGHQPCRHRDGEKATGAKRLERGELIAPFGDKTLKCHQHYYVSTLSGRQWPKIDAFIRLAERTGRLKNYYAFALHQM